ncbi:unnamed protein product [Pleuronectes platessa]|uniref:Uncharacterized protein n=1 Tax=Pleuronectes platessa TaxID=8262 RepID=A0A9N7UPU4_PLEPL|nr:unnamed protein product [Pleuronectes platessa]
MDDIKLIIEVEKYTLPGGSASGVNSQVPELGISAARRRFGVASASGVNPALLFLLKMLIVLWPGRPLFQFLPLVWGQLTPVPAPRPGRFLFLLHNWRPIQLLFPLHRPAPSSVPVPELPPRKPVLQQSLEPKLQQFQINRVPLVHLSVPLTTLAAPLMELVILSSFLGSLQPGLHKGSVFAVCPASGLSL